MELYIFESFNKKVSNPEERCAKIGSVPDTLSQETLTQIWPCASYWIWHDTIQS